MSHNHRSMSGIAGLAFGALLAPPLICLIASPLASADPSDSDIVTLGPDTLSINDATGAFNNYLTDTVGTTTYDLDSFYGPGTDNYGVLFTDPGLFQLGYEDVAGTPTLVDIFNPADFISTDPGLTEIGGGAAVGADAIAGLFGL